MFMVHLRNWQRRIRRYHLGDRTFEVPASTDELEIGELTFNDSEPDISGLRHIAHMLANEPEALAWRITRLEEAIEKIRTRLGI